MNKFKMVGVAIAVACGLASAQLWTPKAKYGQVAFPWVVECRNTGNFDESKDDDPCYKQMGGFWWGYLYGWKDAGQVGERECAGKPGQSAIGGPKSAINKVEAFIDNRWVNFNGPDDPKCVGPDITVRTTGQSLIGDALQVRMTVGDGFLEDPVYSPSGSGFGVTLVENEATSTPRDITKYADGFCLTYSSDHTNTKVGLANSGANLQLALGWNEGYEDPPEERNHFIKGVDGWYAIIPEAPNGAIMTKDFKWVSNAEAVMGDDPNVQNEAGDFIQDNYTKWGSWQTDGKNGGNNGIPAGAPFPIESATKEMTSVKIVWKGYQASVVNFKLYEFGFAGTCGKTGIIAGGVRPASPVSFAMVGKTLSMSSTSGKPLAVQVINLKGAVVRNKIMSNGDELNLQTLPAGVYMVRVPAQNYTTKIIR